MRALWLYCDVAYFRVSVPNKVIDKTCFRLKSNINGLLQSRKIIEKCELDEVTKIEKYWIRMGNDFYPHMKICISMLPDRGKNGGSSPIFSVDTHDQHVLSVLPSDSNDWRAFYGIHKQNMKLKHNIEKRWKREGVPTEKWLLAGEKISDMPKKENYLPRHVLIADDEQHIRLVMKEILLLFNCDTYEATDGQEALDLAWEYKDSIAFALFDIMMPSVTGLTVVETLKRKNRLTFPYIFLSGMPRRQADPRNEHEFISKPFTKWLLIEKIKKIINKLNDDQTVV